MLLRADGIFQRDSLPCPPRSPIEFGQTIVVPILSGSGCLHESNAESTCGLFPPRCIFGKMGILMKIFVTVFDLSRCRRLFSNGK
jgi:hypothetical protein